MGKDSYRELEKERDLIKKLAKQINECLTLSKKLLSEQIFMIQEANFYNVSCERKNKELDNMKLSMLNRIKAVENTIDKAIKILD